MSSEDFIMVRHRKKGGKRERKANDALSRVEFAPPMEVEVKVIDERVHASETIVRESDFTQGVLRNIFRDARLLKQFNSPVNSESSEFTADSSFTIKQLVCYGLGNFSVCPIARYQLALIGWLVEIFNLSHLSPRCWLFDPRFSSSEKSFLVGLGYGIIERNEEAKRRSDVRTLYYMPHCDRPLYNNLLWANWTPERLQNTIILGNSFTRMSDTGRCYWSSNLERGRNSLIKGRTVSDMHGDESVGENCVYVERALQYVREYPCTNSFVHNDVFNDTAFHIFSDCATPEGHIEVEEGGACRSQNRKKENGEEMEVDNENNRNSVACEKSVSYYWPESDSSFWTNNKEPIYSAADTGIVTSAMSEQYLK